MTQKILTQEEKELLLKDLLARLPYFVEAQVANIIEGESKPFTISKELTFSDVESFVNDGVVCNIKPYLRPLSSITEEEAEELSKRYVFDIVGNKISIRYHCEGYWDDDTECPTQEYIWLFDWCNKKHFDYRGLIPMGLALPAPEGMYNI